MNIGKVYVQPVLYEAQVATKRHDNIDDEENHQPPNPPTHEPKPWRAACPLASASVPAAPCSSPPGVASSLPWPWAVPHPCSEEENNRRGNIDG